MSKARTVGKIIPIRYDGAYARGGSNTLYMSRQDVIDTLVVIFKRFGKASLLEMEREARAQIKAEKEFKRGNS